MAESRLPIVEAPIEADLGQLMAVPTVDLASFRDGLREGRLVLRRCLGCGRPRYPHGPTCPVCGSEGFRWDDVEPAGVVHSWIRYRRSFLEEFEPLIPYVVLSVELADGGVRLFGRLRGEGEPQIGARTGMVVERWADDTHMFAFELA